VLNKVVEMLISGAKELIFCGKKIVLTCTILVDSQQYIHQSSDCIFSEMKRFENTVSIPYTCVFASEQYFSVNASAENMHICKKT